MVRLGTPLFAIQILFGACPQQPGCEHLWKLTCWDTNCHKDMLYTLALRQILDMNEASILRAKKVSEVDRLIGTTEMECDTGVFMTLLPAHYPGYAK